MACAAGSTVIVWVVLTASGEAPLLAVTVKVEVPLLVGVPESTPALVRVSPAGRMPEDTAKVGLGYPDAVYVYEYAVPTVPVEGAPAAVNSGGTAR